MATVKQVLAAISQDGTLGPNQKRFVTEAIQRAETWCKLQDGPKPRKISNAKNLMTLHEWEDREGKFLSAYMMVDWLKQNSMSMTAVAPLVEEFRQEMLAKGKQYANFKMAFQTYLTKGYLSKTMEQCKSQSQTIIHTKGVNL